jgi:hypothetical protein
LNAYQTRMGDIQDMQVVTACVNRFTLNSRYAPTLSLVPVQQRLAEMRKQRVDEFLARADELYGLWTTAGVGPRIPASPAARPRGTSRAGDGPGVVHAGRTPGARRPRRRGIRQRPRRRARH